jgi:hypothetical protein
MIWEHYHEWWADKDLERCSRGLFEGNISAFAPRKFMTVNGKIIRVCTALRYTNLLDKNPEQRIKYTASMFHNVELATGTVPLVLRLLNERK